MSRRARASVLGASGAAILALIGSAAVAATPGTPASARGHAADGAPTLPAGSALSALAGNGVSLSGVTALGPDNVWAVGSQRHGDVVSTLVEHFDGTTWSVVPSPNPDGADYNVLAGVDAVADRDVWAVGLSSSAATEELLIEHWDGRSWQIVPGPSLDAVASGLNAVSAGSPDNVQGVGFTYGADGHFYTLALRWDGVAWRVLETPAPRNTVRSLLGVDVSDENHAWAVGSTFSIGTFEDRALALHWNGQTWHRASVPSPGLGYNQLRSVQVVAPGEAWAVGDFNNSKATRFPLVVHRIGAHWTQVHIPGVGVGVALKSVSADGPDDVWMVGGKGGQSPSAVLAHWDGKRWTTYGGPAASTTQLASVTAHSTAATWAVGVRQVGQHQVAARERWNGQAWVR